MTDLSLLWYLAVIDNEKAEKNKMLGHNMGKHLERRIWSEMIKFYSWIFPLVLFGHKLVDRNSQSPQMYLNFVARRCF